MLQREVDLFSIGQGLHWLPVEETLREVSKEMRDDSYFVVLGYRKPIIYDGKNLEESIDTWKLECKDFDFEFSKPEQYTFDKSSEVMKDVSDAYE